MSLRDEIGQRREEILRIARAHGASRVRLFGSAARRSERSDSDTDILVSADHSTIFDLAAMEEELERSLGRKVQVVSDRGLKPSARDAILREAVEV